VCSSRAVFLSESLIVDVPLAVAVDGLLSFLRVGDLDSVATAAFGEGATVLARAGVRGTSKMVAVESIPAYQRGPATVLPLRWVATGPLSGAFPVLDANLELTGSNAQTSVTVIGSYRPPLGKAGEAIDRVVLNAVARASLRSFLGQLAKAATGLNPSRSSERPELGFVVPGQP
jgi:hypothetical protein